MATSSPSWAQVTSIQDYPAFFIGYPLPVSTKISQFWPSWAQVPPFFSGLFRRVPPTSFSKSYPHSPAFFVGYPLPVLAKKPQFYLSGAQVRLHGPHSWFSSLFRRVPSTGFSQNSALLPFTYFPEKAEATPLQWNIPRAKQSATDWQQHLYNARIVGLSATRRNNLIDAGKISTCWGTFSHRGKSRSCTRWTSALGNLKPRDASSYSEFWTGNL